jgi:hypothetical protein
LLPGALIGTQVLENRFLISPLPQREQELMESVPAGRVFASLG